jgi:hypothetical protein
MFSSLKRKIDFEEEQSASYHKISKFIALNTALLCDSRPWTSNIGKYIGFT